MLKKFRRLINKVTSYFPTPLPTTMYELDSFISSIIDLYALPDMPIYHEAIATAILHIPPTKSWKPKAYFATNVRKTMANRVAYEVLQIIKQKEKDESSLNEQPKEA